MGGKGRGREGGQRRGREEREGKGGEGGEREKSTPPHQQILDPPLPSQQVGRPAAQWVDPQVSKN
jgi:hypothetical protein